MAINFLIITIVDVANVDMISGVLDNTAVTTDITTILVGDATVFDVTVVTIIF